MKRWLVVTPEYDTIEPVTDEGQGPTITVVDVIEVEAETKRDAIVLGVKLMLENKWRPDKWTKFHWCRDQRCDKLSPYAGVKAFPVENDP